MAGKKTEYSIKLEVEGGKASAAVVDNLGKSFDDLGNAVNETDGDLDKLRKSSNATGDSLQSTGRAATDAGDDISRAGQQSQQSARGFESLSGKMVALQSSLGVVGMAASAIMAPFQALGETIQETGRLVSQAKLYNIDAGFLGQLTSAAKTTGAELDDVLDVLRDVRERVGEALSESAIGNDANTFSLAFGALGVDKEGIQKFANDTTAMFDFFYDQIAESMETGNAAIQFRLQEISSAGYEKVGPIVAAGLQRGIDSAKALRQEMRQLGFDLTQGELSDIGGLNAQFGMIGQSIEALKQKFLLALAPAVRRVTDAVLGFFKALNKDGTLKDLATTIGNMLDKMVTTANLKEKFAALGESIRGWAGTINEFLSNDPVGTTIKAAEEFGEKIGQSVGRGIQSALTGGLSDWFRGEEEEYIEVPAITPERWREQQAQNEILMAEGIMSLETHFTDFEKEVYSVESALEGMGVAGSSALNALTAATTTYGSALGEVRRLATETRLADQNAVATAQAQLAISEKEFELLQSSLSEEEQRQRLTEFRIRQERAAGREALKNTLLISKAEELREKNVLERFRLETEIIEQQLSAQLLLDDLTEKEITAIEKLRRKNAKAADDAAAEFNKRAENYLAVSDEMLANYDETTETLVEIALQQDVVTTAIEKSKEASDTWLGSLQSGLSGIGGLVSQLFGSQAGGIFNSVAGVVGSIDGLFSSKSGGGGSVIGSLVSGVGSLFGGSSSGGTGGTGFLSGLTDTFGGLGDVVSGLGAVAGVVGGVA